MYIKSLIVLFTLLHELLSKYCRCNVHFRPSPSDIDLGHYLLQENDSPVIIRKIRKITHLSTRTQTHKPSDPTITTFCP